MNRERGDGELERIAFEAAAWIVRRDRGLGPREAEEFRRWFRADPRHGAMLAEREREWRRFAVLAKAPVTRERTEGGPARGFWRLAVPVGIAAAAWFVWFAMRPPDPSDAVAPEPVATAPKLPSLVPEQRLFLADGSVIDLAPGAQVDVALDAVERRIRLMRGAAHFAVGRDPARPFVVVTDAGVEVRALGTSFDVWIEPTKVDVRVVSGRVQVRSASSGVVKASGSGLVTLDGGQRVVVPTDRVQTHRVEALGPSGVGTNLPERYEFDRTPLARVALELNRRGDIRLVVEDAELAELPIYASFRADRADAFVRLLEATGEMTAEREGETVRLKRRR